MPFLCSYKRAFGVLTMSNNEQINAAMGKLLNSHTVQIERILPGPIERVFDYLSKPEYLEKWLMPALVEHELGGRIQYCSEPIPEHVAGPAKNKADQCLIRGTITGFEAPRLIAYTWNELSHEVATEVRFELKQIGDEVQLTVTHSRLPADFMAAVAAGWHTHLETVIALLKGETPTEFFSRFNPRFEEYRALFAAAGIIAATAGAPQAIASADPAYDAIKTARSKILQEYDQAWREVGDLQYKIKQLEKVNSKDSDRALDDLNRVLKQTNSDLHKLEIQLKDLDKALL